MFFKFLLLFLEIATFDSSSILCAIKNQEFRNIVIIFYLIFLPSKFNFVNDIIILVLLVITFTTINDVRIHIS